MISRGEPTQDAKAAAAPRTEGSVKARVEEHFSSVSERYHEKNYLEPVARGQYPDILVRHHRILEMVQDLEGRALDVGCGSGRLLLDLQRRGFEVTGVDYSPAMVEASRSLLLRAGSSPLPDLSVGDIERLEFPDASFDLVVAAGVIEYLPSDDRALSEIRRVLKPGGVAIVSVRNRVNLSRPLLLARDALQAIPGIGRAVRGAHRLFRRVVPASATPYWPDVRYHVPWRFRASLQRLGLEVEETAAYHFAVCPPLVRRIAPRLAIKMGLVLENFSRTAIGNFAGAHVVRARVVTRSPSPSPADALPVPRPGTAPPAVIVRLGVTGLGVARSLTEGELPARVRLIAVDASFSHPAGRTRLCEKHVCEELDSAPVIARLVELAGTLPDKPVLFITDDSTVLRVAAEEERLRPHFRFLIPPLKTVHLLGDKTAFAEYARVNGFRVPRTFVIRGEEDIERAAKELPFPSILKPAWRPPAWEAAKIPKAFIVAKPAELFETFRAHAPMHPTYVAQEWIPGSDSEIYYCLVYFDGNGRCRATFTGRKLRQWPRGAGNTSITEPFPCPEIERETVRLLEAVGFRGLGSVEFKRDPRDGEFKIMEPTVGRPNLQSEVATANGVNFPWIAYADLAGIPRGCGSAPLHPVRWVNEFTDVQSGLDLVREGVFTLREWVTSYRGAKRYALFSWRDPMPFLSAGRKNGKDVLRRVFRQVLRRP